MSSISQRIRAALGDRYDLLDQVGEGGMATVHRATDRKHHREVALKVLRPELALTGERFLQEIRVTAALQHPGIVPLYDSGEADGLLYYVMPLVRGESLRARLDRDGALPLSEALEVTRAVASTLAYAHEEGVVHRDIKPSNILFSQGQPLVADFGIARAMSAAGAHRLTATGLSVGSPAYMSPEQAFGEGEVDGRADVYSLGCMLYEMVSGRLPFDAASPQALLARRLTEPPPVLGGAPPSVAEAVRRAMATQVNDRFATARELARALVEAAAEAGRSVEPSSRDAGASIVVLPLKNLSPDPDNAFFADGLTEEIISDLSHVSELRVISRTSAMRYKDSEAPLPVIARELDVRYVLEGSVRRAGDAIRVTSQLIEAENDAQLWSGKFGGTVDDVFEIQERISRQIVEALAETLSPDAAEELPERRPEDPRARDLYLKVRHAVWEFTPEGLARARALLDDAAGILEESALLTATRAHVLYHSVNFGIEVEEANILEAETLARRALEMDPECAQAWSVLGWLLASRHKVREGLPALQRARELDPSDSEVAAGYIFITSMTGSLDEEDLRLEVRDFVERDPFLPIARTCAMWLPFVAGRFEAAVGHARHAERLDGSSVFRLFTAICLAEAGRTGDAAAHLRSGSPALEEGMWPRLTAAYLAAFEGDAAGARALVNDDLRAWAEPDFQYCWHMAQLYALTRDLDEAYRWLVAAVEAGFSNVEFLERHDRLLEPLRGTERFRELMARARVNRAEMRAAMRGGAPRV